MNKTTNKNINSSEDLFDVPDYYDGNGNEYDFTFCEMNDNSENVSQQMNQGMDINPSQVACWKRENLISNQASANKLI